MTMKVDKGRQQCLRRGLWGNHGRGEMEGAGLGDGELQGGEGIVGPTGELKGNKGRPSVVEEGAGGEPWVRERGEMGCAGLGDRELQGGEAAVFEDIGRGWRVERKGCSVLPSHCYGGNKTL